MRHTIQDNGGLQSHMEKRGLSYELFRMMAEANWVEPKGQYNGVRTMGRVMGVSDTTVIKYLRIYDAEIGRTRNKNLTKES